MSEVVVALGGNAILRHHEEGTAEDQLTHIRETSARLAEIIEAGHSLIVTHGNGPQVGDILLAYDLAKARLPPMPLDVCGAESQGMLGYMFQRCMDQEFVARGVDRPVVTLVTQVEVDPADAAFENPTKFIGPYYTAMEAGALRKDKGWVIREQSGKGFRRVVPSPQPKRILELDSIRTLFNAGAVVIAAGGGGIPISENGRGAITGVEAVIDKDHTSALLAQLMDADVLLILTDVERVALDFGKPTEREVSEFTVEQAREQLEAGQFPEGSMGPKIESCLRFVEGGGDRAIITSLERARDALDGKAGTTIHA